MKKYAIPFLLLILICGGLYATRIFSKPLSLGGPGVVTLQASSTAYTLTTTSRQLVATSTRRSALTVQPISCTSSGTTFLNLGGKDAPASANQGYAVLASSTAQFSDDAIVPDSGSVQGIVNVGTCTVLVTEWKNIF